MNRPYIICHILSALDGKITGEFMGVESARSVSEEYARIRAEYQADAWLYGTVTTKEFTGWRKPELDFTMFLLIRREKLDGNQAHSIKRAGRTLM